MLIHEYVTLGGITFFGRLKGTTRNLSWICCKLYIGSGSVANDIFIDPHVFMFYGDIPKT